MKIDRPLWDKLNQTIAAQAELIKTLEEALKKCYVALEQYHAWQKENGGKK